jgi:hypothetical protein
MQLNERSCIMKNPANHSLSLSVDQAFVERVAKLTGHEELSGDDLSAVLKAGLRAMETAANGNTEICADPDCIACRIRAGEAPNQRLLREFQGKRPV